MEEQDLSPWAHPKARAWFAELFKRTQFSFVLEDLVQRPVDQLDYEQVRAVMAFVVLLGREGIWPEEDRRVLTLILDQCRAMLNATPDTVDRQLTLQQHRNRGNVKHELQDEIEILRRRVGKSFKTTDLDVPQSWDPFWT